MTDTYYRAVAEDVLRAVGTTEPPTDLDAVADWLGVSVQRVHADIPFSSAIVEENGAVVLVLDSGLEGPSRRRHLARRLGELLSVPDGSDPHASRGLRTGRREAEVVATELLMPSWLLREQALRWFNDDRYLARLFEVSEADMRDRMLDLGLLKTPGRRWDY